MLERSQEHADRQQAQEGIPDKGYKFEVTLLTTDDGRDDYKYQQHIDDNGGEGYINKVPILKFGVIYARKGR